MDFFNQIKSELEKMATNAQNNNWSETQWTIGVKEAIIKVGGDNKYRTAANQVKSDDGKEWLYDIVWYQADSAGHLTDVPLIVESEWGNSKLVKEDFEKLLVARSIYRVMVFQKVDKDIVSLIKEMKLWIFKFSSTAVGDKYLFAGWDKDKWIFDSYTHKL